MTTESWPETTASGVIEPVEVGLTALLEPVFGPVEVLERGPNPFQSTLVSEVVTCRTADGQRLQLLIKSPRGNWWAAFGHRGGVGYEAAVYRNVLTPLGLSRPSYHGVLADGSIVMDYLGDCARVDLAPNVPLLAAAAWIARFHKVNEIRVGRPELAFLRRYDQDYFRGWSRRASRYADRERVPWLEELCKRFEALIAERLLQRPTVIHGEYYPENMLCDGGEVHPVDWESAAVAPGEIDLAMLTQGWNEEEVRCCEAEYRRVRWPDGPPGAHFEAQDMAYVFVALRWLGDPPLGNGELDPHHVAWLQSCGEQAGLI